MAAIQAACEHGAWKEDAKTSKEGSEGSGSETRRNKGRVMCLCIGDGSTPRTAVLACYLRGWECVSIDPALHEEWRGVSPKGVRGLTGYGGTLEEYLTTTTTTRSVERERNGHGATATATTAYDHLILLCVHSHARLIDEASVPNIAARYNGDGERIRRRRRWYRCRVVPDFDRRRTWDAFRTFVTRTIACFRRVGGWRFGGSIGRGAVFVRRGLVDVCM
mmetsp:Transcript_33592/g.72631  ORF Transcript_33592/g.72631 Transcript_33592/m.72631 type:complete len:220 (+) Transcript_33592:394-1053(+)